MSHSGTKGSKPTSTKGLTSTYTPKKRRQKSTSLLPSSRVLSEEISFQELHDKILDLSKIISPEDKQKLMNVLETLSNLSTVCILNLGETFQNSETRES